MNFHATFFKQFLIKHILSCFSAIREALQNICVMHTLQYEHVLTFWCNVTYLSIHICDMLCLINYIFFQYIIIVCTLVWYDIYDTCSKHFWNNAIFSCSCHQNIYV